MTRQDQQKETSASDAGVEEQTAGAAAEPADDVTEPDDDVIVAETDDVIVAETDDVPDDGVIVAEPDDVVVAEVVDEEPGPSGAAGPTWAADEPSADTSRPTSGVTGPAPAGPGAGVGLSQQWRDIQATFVDDPRGAVRLAAETSDAALNSLIASLRSRQNALSAAAGDTGEHRDTEQLRGELRQYRVLCQNLAQIGQRLAQPG